MTKARMAIVAIAMVAVVGTAGCGGTHTKSNAPATAEPQASAPPPAAALDQANANCRFLLSKIKVVAQGILSRSHSQLLETINTQVLPRALSVLEQVANSQQALEPTMQSPTFDRYASFFDPIIVLAQMRLQTGRAGDTAGSRNLESLLTTLGIEQQQAARVAGLPDCERDFEHSLLSSFSS
jgi:hypothetical protein